MSINENEIYSQGSESKDVNNGEVKYAYNLSEREKKSPYYVTFLAAYGVRTEQVKKENEALVYNQQIEPSFAEQPIIPTAATVVATTIAANKKKKFSIVNFFIAIISLVSLAISFIGEFVLPKVFALGYNVDEVPLSAIGYLKELMNNIKVDPIVINDLTSGIFVCVIVLFTALTLLVSLFSLKKKGAPLFNKIALALASTCALTLSLIQVVKFQMYPIGGIVVTALSLLMLCMAVLSPSNKVKKINGKKAK